MFDIKFQIGDIEVESVEEEDINEIYNWFKAESSYLDENKHEEISENQFCDRFVEYYLSECEFFIKVMICDELIGMIKGRIEFINPNNVWFGYILISEECRNKGIGTTILNSIINYFNTDFGIFNFSTRLRETNMKSLNFWKKSGFIVTQLTNEERKIQGCILKRSK
jgi:RimJ/RimL family protein N-acetyltransferase